MVLYSRDRIKTLIDRGKITSDKHEKGRVLEELACYLFEEIPGVQVYGRDVMNYFQTEELDIVLWNEQEVDGLKSFHSIILIECKNIAGRVGTEAVAYFITKLENRGLNFGILIASNGITGSETDSTRAHFEVPIALSKGIRLIIINLEEILELTSTENLIQLIKEKICKLFIKGSINM